MIGSEADEQAANAGSAGGGRAAERTELVMPRAWLAALLLAAVVGALVAALAAYEQQALADGRLQPALSTWRRLGRWLPLACIGAGLGRVLVQGRRGRRLLPLLMVGIVAVAVGLQRIAPHGTWASSLVGLLLGLLPGACWRVVRQCGAWSTLAASAVAAMVAFGASRLAAASDVLALALAGTLLVALLPIPGATSPSRGGGWRVALWSVGVGLAGFGLSGIATHAAAWSAAVGVLLAMSLANGRTGLAFGAGAVLAALAGFAPAVWTWQSSLARDEAALVPLGVRGAVALQYRRRDQELRLVHRDSLLLAVGPDRDELSLLTALAHACVRHGDRVLLLGHGAERVAQSLAADGRALLDAVATGTPELDAWLACDGPVAAPASAPRARVAAAPPVLARIPDGARQLVLVTDYAAALPHRATASYQQQLRRVAGRGVVLQVVALDRQSAPQLRQLLAALAAAHPCNEVFRVGDAVVIASSAAPLAFAGLPAEVAGDPACSETVRWSLHRAHLGGAADLRSARLGRLRASDEVRGITCVDASTELVAWMVADGGARRAVAGDRDSLLAGWRQRRQQLQDARAQLGSAEDSAAGRAAALALARAQLPFGVHAAGLVAALGLEAADGGSVLDPRLASRCAFAIDPTFFAAPPPVFRALPRPRQERGDLEDLHRVVAGPRLAVRCVGMRPLAVALRARFPSACARSLVAQLRDGPLLPAAAAALSELVDVFVLRECAAVLADVTRGTELLPLWRHDLPAPPLVTTLARAVADGVAPADLDAELRQALAVRHDASCYTAVAALLVSDRPDVLAFADAWLEAAVGERVPFQPQWSRSQRADAALCLSALHNRRP